MSGSRVTQVAEERRHWGVVPVQACSRVLRAAIALSLTLSLSGCANALNSAEGSLTTSCILYADQGATISGRWLKTPVPVALAAGQFSAQDTQALVAAAATWNSFFAASMGYPAIDIGSTTSPRTSTQPLTSNETTFCSNANATQADSMINLTSSELGTYNSGAALVIYKDYTWPYSASSADQSIIALTTTCPDNNGSSPLPIPFFTNGYMELNYQCFFDGTCTGMGVQTPDLQSIILHELGHVLGLRHSCEPNSTANGMPDCKSGTLPPLYANAVMYPSFSFFSNGIGIPRQMLNQDDEGRMNCVYQDL